MALRWFAGGEPADIFHVHGVHCSRVYTGVWETVDAINLCPTFQMPFPNDHNEQMKIAAGFQEKSSVNFQGCVGCIDGMLVWTNKPSKRSLDPVGVGPKKFFCGRKKKIGLNLQATCDHKRRFLDIEAEHPAATSDCLCFTASDIHLRLKEAGFLADGLCLFWRQCLRERTFCGSSLQKKSWQSSRLMLSTKATGNDKLMQLEQLCQRQP